MDSLKINPEILALVEEKSKRLRESIFTMQVKTTSPIGNGHNVASRIVRVENGDKITSVYTHSSYSQAKQPSTKEFLLRVFDIFKWSSKLVNKNNSLRLLGFTYHTISNKLWDTIVKDLSIAEIEKADQVSKSVVDAINEVIASGKANKRKNDKERLKAIDGVTNWIREALRSGVTEKEIKDILKLELINRTMEQ